MAERKQNTSDLNRRDFFKIGSILGLAGVGHLSCTSEKAGRKMITRRLGKTGIDIPVVSMGTGNCDSPALVKLAYDKGIKLFATSEYYGNGNNEKMLGEALKDRPRNSFIIMTGAIGGLSIDYRNGIFKPDTDPKAYKEHLDGSLKRLQMEYIDILSLGYGAKKEYVTYEPVVEVIKRFKSEGKAKYVSLTTHSFEPEAIRSAVDAGIYDIITVGYNFRKNNLDEIDAALEDAASAGIGIIAMKTMAGAFWDKDRTQPINARAALKWVLQNQNIHTTIPDCASIDHLETDLAIMDDLSLTPEEREDLKMTSETTSTGLFCQQCGRCLEQCPEDLDIPTLMRSYMYAYGYCNLSLARRTAELASMDSLPCMDCLECSVKCEMGFDIRRKLLDIGRIRHIPNEMIRHV